MPASQMAGPGQCRKPVLLRQKHFGGQEVQPRTPKVFASGRFRSPVQSREADWCAGKDVKTTAKWCKIVKNGENWCNDGRGSRKSKVQSPKSKVQVGGLASQARRARRCGFDRRLEREFNHGEN